MFITVTIFLFFFISNLMYWLFGFKYWVIAVEIPIVLKENDESEVVEGQEVGQRKKRFCTETKY